MEFAEVTYVERVDYAALLRRTFKLRGIVAFIHTFINDRSHVYSTRAQALDESVRHCIFINVQANLHVSRTRRKNISGLFHKSSFKQELWWVKLANRNHNRSDCQLVSQIGHHRLSIETAIAKNGAGLLDSILV